MLRILTSREVLEFVFSVDGIKIILYMTGGLFYFISPWDFIPEVIFGLIGYVDDIIVGLLALILVGSVIFARFGRRE